MHLHRQIHKCVPVTTPESIRHHQSQHDEKYPTNDTTELRITKTNLDVFLLLFPWASFVFFFALRKRHSALKTLPSIAATYGVLHPNEKARESDKPVRRTSATKKTATSSEQMSALRAFWSSLFITKKMMHKSQHTHEAFKAPGQREQGQQ